MADQFKIRIVAKPDENRREKFKSLVEILSSAAERGELDLDDLCDGFRDRDFPVNLENIIAEDDLVSFDVEVAYGIFIEGKVDFMSDWGVGELRMLYAHERPTLSDWEENDEEYKTIGMVILKNKWALEDGDWTVVDSGSEYRYPPEDDIIKMTQWWLLAWAGVQPSGYGFEEFFGQVDARIAERAMQGITIINDGEEDDFSLWDFPEKVVGFRPLEAGAKFRGNKEDWWSSLRIG